MQAQNIVNDNTATPEILYRFSLTLIVEMNISDLYFQIDDTHEGCYRDITSSLCSKGWTKVIPSNKSKIKRRKFPSKDAPLLIWTINEKDLSYHELDRRQICNHYEGIVQLTTKMGFCDILREARWLSEDALELSPR